MITLSNMRIEPAGDWTRLVCDFNWGGVGLNDSTNPFEEKTMWFAVRNEDADFLSLRVYDPFLLVPYYIGMYYGQDVKLCGNVSKRLYRNVTNYAQRILQDFSDHLHPIHLEVEGFDRVEEGADLVGTGISCGVDSLSTIYDHYIQESDPEYRVNSLFIFNSGTHGHFENPRTREVFLERYEMNRRAADELGLPVYLVDSNLHAFTHKIGETRVGFFAIYSCIFCMQRRISKYYTSSGFSYRETAQRASQHYDHDMDGFCGSYMVPLIQTDRLELIFDGAQYTRSEKTRKIADWELARKHLNVCVAPGRVGVKNCSCCGKCVRTLTALDAFDKLENFSEVFNLEAYRKRRFEYLCKQVVHYKTENFDADNIDAMRANHKKLPSVGVAYSYLFALGCFRGARRVARRAKRKLCGALQRKKAA